MKLPVSVLQENIDCLLKLLFFLFIYVNIYPDDDLTTNGPMSLPRCAKPNPLSDDGKRWNVKELTYRISKYSKNLNPTEVDEEIARAFSVWSEYADFTFTPKKDGPVHIEISFEKGYDGDGYPFHNGGVLVHATYPTNPAYIHFNDAELWTINSAEGLNLIGVAAHGIGHTLGLRHSKIESAVMFPLHNSYDPNFRLTSDDIYVRKITRNFTYFWFLLIFFLFYAFQQHFQALYPIDTLKDPKIDPVPCSQANE